MVFITYRDNGENDIHQVTSYFYKEEDAKEYSELMGQQYTSIPHISREYWPEKVKYVYCSAWPHNNEIKIDIREYEILSNDINTVTVELFTSPTSISKCFFCTKEEAEKEFNEIVGQYKQIYRPNIYGAIHAQMIRKDLEGLTLKKIEGQECWGTQEDWDRYETYKASLTAVPHRSSVPLFSGNYYRAGGTIGTADFTPVYQNLQIRVGQPLTVGGHAVTIGGTEPVILSEGTNEQQQR